ncbi:hypothetical protein [Roseibium sp.]|uniref:hypothetical protein n=1 Tax=Roseibium sp. TaxID=1936156 RepID=UPI0032635FB7
MHAQNELSPYFAEIDRRTDRALKGIREVRRSAKFKTLPAQPRSAALATGLLVVLALFAGMFLD